MIKLANPCFLLIGLVFILFLLKRKAVFLGYSHLPLLDAPGVPQVWHHLPSLLSAVAVGLLILAMARPQWRTVLEHEKFLARDILLVIDLSYSMENSIDSSKGEQIDRGAGSRKIDIAKKAALQFIEKRENDRIGLLVFGDQTFGSWPLTRDLDLISKKVDRLGASFYGGTNLWQPFLKVIDHFREMGQSENRILVFLSDGEAPIKQPMRDRIVEEIKQMGIRFYLLGIELRPKDNDILEIVKRAGGRFIPTDSPAEMQTAFDEINRLEPSMVQIEVKQKSQELYPLFVSAALCVMLTVTVLRHTLFLELC
jgi:Ca-activated chloride channel family protein